MNNQIELLAPGGDIDSIKAAIAAGADAIYCGLNQFNARNRATNIEFEDLNGILRLAHKNNCQIFLTLNIVFIETEIPTLLNLLNKLANTSIDGVIVQDLGLLYLLQKHFKSLKVHGSTQLTTHNKGQIHFLNDLNICRVNLSRELSLKEIKELASAGHKNNISTEVFVHGSNCIAFSGVCYISSVHGGKSGNRGRCSQPCRDRYITTAAGKNYPLNLKDNSAFYDLEALFDAGVDSLKIEGRIKQFDYVYTVVNCWKKRIKSFENQSKESIDNSDLYKVFNRDFTNSYLKGDINKEMFIDNPMDNSIKQFANIDDSAADTKLLQEKTAYYAEKDQINFNVKSIIKQLSTDKASVSLNISGQLGSKLEVTITTPDTSFKVLSDSNLIRKSHLPAKGDAGEKAKKNSAKGLDHDLFYERFKTINNTEYYIKDLEFENLESDLFIPFKELTLIKNRILYTLNDSKEHIAPVILPKLQKSDLAVKKPTLSVLISSEKDLHLCKDSSADIYYKIPSSFKDEFSKLADIFINNKNLTPWFPSILIGEDYITAVEFIKQVQPKLLVSDNTGIAYQACKLGINWIAGPNLNITNSYSILCLKEKFNCYGSFISNELNQQQIKNIKRPENFEFYYSIFHPILLMKSRQCLHHQVIECDKTSFGEDCIQNCNKSSTITSLKGDSLYIKKQKGSCSAIYNDHNFLNTKIIEDFPDKFSSLFIDLRDIKTETKVGVDKLDLIKLFKNAVAENSASKSNLQKIIHPSINAQYYKGI